MSLPLPPYFDSAIWGADAWPILSASYTGDIKTVTELLDKDPANIQAQFAYYEPLHFAVRGGNLPMVQLLIDRGAHPLSPGWHTLGDETPITKARDRGRVDMVELLEKAIDKLPVYTPPAHQPPTGEEKLKYDFEIACGYSVEINLVKQILGIHPGWATLGLYEAVHHNRISIVRLLIKAGAKMNGHMPFACWFTPLMHALRYHEHNWELAELVLEQGISVNSINGLGMSALHIAIVKDDIEGLNWLLNHGAEVNLIESESCSTPLGWAAKLNRPEMVKILLRKNADARLPLDEPWAAPIRWAEKRGHIDIVKLLT